MVTQTSLISVRGPYYDRNPSSKGSSFSLTGTAPHAQTNRIVYSVPTGRKAIVTTGTGQIRRAVAATTVGEAQVLMAGAGGTFYVLSNKSNTVDQQLGLTVGPAESFNAADNVVVQTSDASTAGTVDYAGSIGIEEFDA